MCADILSKTNKQFNIIVEHFFEFFKKTKYHFEYITLCVLKKDMRIIKKKTLEILQGIISFFHLLIIKIIKLIYK